MPRGKQAGGEGQEEGPLCHFRPEVILQTVLSPIHSYFNVQGQSTLAGDQRGVQIELLFGVI